MFKQAAIGISVAAALGLSTGANALFTIDDFSDNQAQLQVTPGTTGTVAPPVAAIPAVTNQSSTASGAMATGERDIWIGLAAGTVEPTIPRTGDVSVGGGSLVSNQGTSITADIWVQWDGTDAAPTGRAVGSNLPNGTSTVVPGTPNLGTATAFSLTPTGEDAFWFDVIAADQSFYFTIEVVDTEGTATFSGGPTPFIDPSPAPFLTFGPLPFSSFTFAGGCDVTNCFDTVTSLTLKINPGGTARDFEITNFYTDKIPEPMTLALMGLGLAGLGAVRRRKTRA